MATKRRGSGEGSIFQRADGRWAATLDMGYNSKGKRIRRTVYGKTKNAVKQELFNLQVDRRNGLLLEPSKATVAEYLREWLESTVKPTIRSTTWQNYNNAVENHIIPAIGSLQLTKLSPIHIQGLYATLAERLTPNTIRTARIVIRKAMVQALKWRMIAADPSAGVRAPSVEQREMQVLDAEQCGRFLAAAQADRLNALFVLAVTTGMRMSELFGLQWQDIDLDGGKLSVVRTATYVRDKLVIAPPKTPKSRRNIDLPAMAVEALREHRKLSLREGFAAVPWVFVSRAGTVLRRSNFHIGHFHGILKAAGLERIRFHDLRHTHATLLLSEGVNPKVVQERLGHASITTTLNTYSHVLPSMQRDAADRLQGVLGCQLAVKSG